MKPYINFLLFIIALVLVYTVYGMLTFQPDEPRSFVFSEPKLPADLIRQDEAKNASDSKNNTAGVEEAQKALSSYRVIQKNLPEQTNDTFGLLIDRMTESSLPLYFLSGPDPQNNGMRRFETLNVITDNALVPEKGTKPSLNCKSGTRVNSILVGTSAPDIIQCETARDTINNGQDFIMIGGPENDQITDATGNRIVNGGTGDDIIKLGAGRNIIVLDESWGKDTLTVDCTGGMIAANEIPNSFPIPWVYKTSNFIVLGKGINPADVVWKENVLTNQVTGDTLTVSQNCFTVVPKIQ